MAADFRNIPAWRWAAALLPALVVGTLMGLLLRPGGEWSMAMTVTGLLAGAIVGAATVFILWGGRPRGDRRRPPAA